MLQTISGIQKLNIELTNLKREMRSLRSLLVGLVGEDSEGKYRPEFIKEILDAAQEKPNYVFKNKNSFLSQLRRI